ncbi:bacitracin resistance protein BacA [Kiritimatiellota bacterium B12222]|nr:bacitracin resistance protein BacA [Kiritimatiellota bacterium B12222]
MDSQLYVPPQGPPQISAPHFFDKIGLEKLYEMAWIQYQLFKGTSIASLFPVEEEALKEASEKQAEFMAGVMGGPRLYIEKHGPPRMRARHVPFVIDEAARQAWLDCYKQAFVQCDGLGLTQDEQQVLLGWIEGFSAWMVNRAG